MQLSINAWALGAVALFLAYKAFRHFYWDKAELVTPEGLPVPLSVGKERSFHSLTRDASMYTEARRRRAILRNPTPKFQKSGFTNGVVEAFFLTGICDRPCIRCKNIDYVEDAGNAWTEELCNILDANGGELLDFGNAGSAFCDPVFCNKVEDAGNARTEETCNVIDGSGQEVLDFGSARTTICQV